MINELLKELVNKLNLGELREEPLRITGGLLNRMYKVTTTNGCYAVKHLNPEVMKRKNAVENHLLAEEIANIAKINNINCIPAKIFDNSTLQQINGNYFLVYDWFFGKAISNTQITSEHIIKIATLIAKLHSLDFGNIKDKCLTCKKINEINWEFYISKIDNKAIKDLLISNKERLIELDKKSTQYAKEIHKDLVISHRDLDLPNVLWDNENNPVIIDWESAGLVNPCEEVIETAWDWSGGQEHFDIDRFKLFIKIYEDNGGILSDFNKAIYSNFKNKSGWLEYNLKRVCRIECIDDEEQKLGESETIRVINEILYFYNVINNILKGEDSNE